MTLALANLNDTIAAALAANLTKCGAACSDDPNYAVECLWTPITDRLIAFGLRFPDSVDAASADALTIAGDVKDSHGRMLLKLHSSARGKDLKFGGLPDHPHWSLVIIAEPILYDEA